MNPVMAKDFLSQITYKPGWKIHIQDQGGGFFVNLMITYMAEDTFHPGRQVQVASIETIPHHIEAFEHFCEWLEKVLLRCEHHEVQEWLKLAATGKPITNPHARDF